MKNYVLGVIRYCEVILLAILIVGCGSEELPIKTESRNADNSTTAKTESKNAGDSATPRDPHAAVAVIQKFFAENPSSPMRVSLLLCGRRPQWMSMSQETHARFLKALRSESQVLGITDPLLLSTGASLASCLMIVEGANYSLVIDLDSVGFGIGPDSSFSHRFINPSLADILREVFRTYGLLAGPHSERQLAERRILLRSEESPAPDPRELERRLLKGAGKLGPNE